MLQAARHSGVADSQAVFEVFARSLPVGRRYGVFAGTGRLLELITDFRFHEPELDYLSANGVVDAQTLTWLSNYRFNGRISGYREGEIYFPYSPVLTVEATFAEAVLLETLVLSVLNFDTAVASAAARMKSAAAGRNLAEMGSRRVSELAAVAAARAAYIAGFAATSNLEAGRSWGIPTMGTAAHAFTLMHDTEEAAFRAQIETFGTTTTLLIDTYNIEAGVRKAIEVAGTELGAVRIDSGDLAIEIAKVRALLDDLGAKNTKITVTNDLDEYAIAALAAVPVNAYGVGTSVSTGSGAPTAGFVYKLVSHQSKSGDWVNVAKTSAQKANIAGRKTAVRRHDADGVASAEVVHAQSIDEVGTALNVKHQDNERNLLVEIMTDGVANQDFVGSLGTTNARAHHAAAVAALPSQALRLTRGEPGIPTLLS
jgi:nicotinate phosphoribosyltransferase